MIVYFNGRLVPAEEARVSVLDRAFLLGDGLFETIAVLRGRPVFWEPHLERLRAGARALGFHVAPADAQLRAAAIELLQRNGVVNGAVRIQVSRGTGIRGYSPAGCRDPVMVITAHPGRALDAGPSGPWRLRTADVRLPPASVVTRYKTTSRLLHVVARAEAESAGVEEALLLSAEGHVAEAAAANVFWFDDAGCRTPALSTGCLAGVTREAILDEIASLGWEVSEVRADPAILRSATGIFLTVSTAGLIEVSELDGAAVPRDERCGVLRERWLARVLRELSD